MSTKLQRYLDIITFLVGKRVPATVDEVMEHVGYDHSESDRRKFERDKDDLRSAGIPLKTIRYTIDGQDIEGYVIERRDFYLPYLKLIKGDPPKRTDYPDRMRLATVEIREPDAPLAIDALRRIANVPNFPLAAEARSAFRKLAFDLDPSAFDRESTVLFDGPPQDPEVSTSLKTLSDALLRRKSVTFHYRGLYRGEETDREVLGYSLLFQSGQWYWIGHDKLRDAIRVFRVSRMSDVQANRKSPNTADYSIPADFRVADYVGRKAWELGEAEEQPVTVRVLFRFPLSLWAERNNYGTVESNLDNGDVVRMFGVHQVEPFLRWLLGLQTDVEILDPAELKDRLRQMAARVATSHKGGVHGRD